MRNDQLRFGMRTVQVFAAIAMCLLLASCVKAQLSTTGAINGTVVDPLGGAVGNASVTIIADSTQVELTTQTNVDGTFVVSGLVADTYTIRVQRDGFQTLSLTSVVVHPATVTPVSCTLQVGKIEVTMSVAASATQVQSSTSEISNQVEGAQIGTLPLNGRNFQALSALMPGTINTSAGSALGTGGRATSNVLAVNGLGPNRIFYALDGVWDENTGNMNANSVVPNPDTLDEVRVLQNNYSARYSLFGSTVVLMDTKSGTSDFHGRIYEYFRNDALNARNFFAPTVSTATTPAVPPYKQNVFGYTFGGPVPKLTDHKTFFFVSEQWVILHTPVTPFGVGQTITPTETAAPFLVPSTTQIYVPGTGTACPYPQTAPGSGVYILAPTTPTPAGCPAATWPATDPNAVAYAKALYPNPNFSSGTNNFLNEVPQITNQRDDEFRIDHNFSDRIKVKGEYLIENQDFTQSSFAATQGGEISPLSFEADQSRNRVAQLALTTTPTATMINTVSYGMNIYLLNLNLGGVSLVNQIPGFNQQLPFHGIASNRVPQVGITNFMTTGAPQARPLRHASDLDQTISDDWAVLHGRHYLQAGINFVTNEKRQNQTGPGIVGTAFGVGTNGEFSFTGTYTGNSLADFLLGDAASFTQASNQIRTPVHGIIISPYLEDRIQITRRFTITIGARVWDMKLPHPEPGTARLFEPSTFVAANAPIVSSNGTITPTATFNPINGLVTNGQNGVPDNWTNAHNWYFGPTAGISWDVFGDGKTAFRGGYGISYTKIFTSGDSCAFNCVINPPAVSTVNLVGTAAAPLSFSNPTGGTARAATVQSLNNADLNIRPTEVQTYSASLQHEFPRNWIASAAGVGSLARHVEGTININQPFATAGMDFPCQIDPNITSYPVSSSCTTTSRNFSPYSFAPFPGYAAISTLASPLTQNWTALELSLRHPISQNVFVTLAYTWSHDLTNSTGAGVGGSNLLSIYQPKLSYGNAEGLNFPQAFTATAIWNVPSPFSDHHGIRGLLANWRYSDITTIRSGSSLTPSLNTTNNGFPARPNVVAGQAISGSRSINEWFNVGAFALPATGFLGNAGTGIIQGPDLVDFDMAVYKNFPFLEHQSIEFRSEAFNVFNHPIFSNPNTTFGNANFGKITSARDPRIFQLSLKYQF